MSDDNVIRFPIERTQPAAPAAEVRMEYGTCSFCKATIAWCVTVNGKRMPLDATPDEGGNVFVRLIDGVITGHVRHKNEDRPEGVAYMPHVASCKRKPTPRRK